MLASYVIVFLLAVLVVGVGVLLDALRAALAARDRAREECLEAHEGHEALWAEFQKLQRRLEFHAKYGALCPDDARKLGQTGDRCLRADGPEELPCAACPGCHDRS
jgi:hypothetical protein